MGLLAAGCSGSGGQQAFPIPTPPTTTPSTSTPPPAPPVQADERRPQRVSFLTRTDSCERFAAAVRPIALANVGPYGFGGAQYGIAMDAMAGAPAPAAAENQRSAGAATPSAPRAGVDFSETNVQEAGIDEPDIVKTDGRILVTTSDGRLRVLDVTGAPRQVGALDLPDRPGTMLLVGNRVLVFGSNVGFDTWRYPSGPGVAPDGTPVRTKSTATVVDIADPAKPKIVRTHTIDGAFVDARLIGGVARLVTRSTPDIRFPQPAQDAQQSPEKAKEANAAIVRQAKPEAFLPQGASCRDAYVPAESSGVGTVAVQSLDPAADALGPAVTVVADVNTVYASATRLFVATTRFNGSGGIETPVLPRDDPLRTALHSFDISDPAKARYTGSGDVPGQLLNQFSMSEEAGMLRVATTLDSPAAGGQGGPTETAPLPGGPAVREIPVPSTQSRVTILRQAGDEWVETGAVDGLGKGERIYAVRFIGTMGYVVTFRQTDPLYVLDLRDPRRPKVTGELKITGYSAYLHPAGDRRLLGLGQEATEQGRRVGAQLSLFDIGDPAAPTKLAGAVLPNASTSEGDHHAFLYWPATGLVVVPVQSHDGGPRPSGQQGVTPFVGVVAFRVGDRSVAEAGRITHPGQTPIDRSLVVGDRLLTLSPVGVATNNLSTLADGGFVAFR